MSEPASARPAAAEVQRSVREHGGVALTCAASMLDYDRALRHLRALEGDLLAACEHGVAQGSASDAVAEARSSAQALKLRIESHDRSQSGEDWTRVGEAGRRLAAALERLRPALEAGDARPAASARSARRPISPEVASATFS